MHFNSFQQIYYYPRETYTRINKLNTHKQHNDQSNPTVSFGLITCFQNERGLPITDYWGHRYVPVERSWTREMCSLNSIKCDGIILYHFDIRWWDFPHTFHYFTDEIFKKSKKTCQNVHESPVPLICIYHAQRAMCLNVHLFISVFNKYM